MPSKPTPDRFLSFAEVAEMLSISEGTLRNGEAGTNEIPRIKLSNRCVRFSFNAVQAWMAAKAREAERARLQSEMAVHSLMASKSERRRAVKDTLLTIINGGKYR
jgi:predicted DNA-binding transcriptional regulator AlpA